MYNRNIVSYKCTLIGDSGVGKSSIVTRAIRNTFDVTNDSTIGAAFYTLQRILSNLVVKLEIWDTAGQERFASLVTMYLRSAHAIILVYDLNDLNSYNSINERWIPYLNKDPQYRDDAQWYLIANKYDLNNDTTLIDKGKHLAIELNAKFFITSAKDNFNIQELITDITETLVNKNFKLNSPDIPKTINLKEDPKQRDNCFETLSKYFRLPFL